MFLPKGSVFWVIGLLLSGVWPSDSAAQGGGAAATELPAVQTYRLQNGIRVIHLPGATSGETEIAFGYAAGVRNEPGYPKGIAELARLFLAASVPARSVAMAAHLGGGAFDFVVHADMVGMRVSVPNGMAGTVLDEVVGYFETPKVTAEAFEYAREQLRRPVGEGPDEFRESVDVRIGARLLGDVPYLWSGAPTHDQIDRLQVQDLVIFFRENFGTDRAYVIVSQELADGDVARFESIALRRSGHNPASAELTRIPGSSLELPSRSEGGVVIATVVPSVHYDAWFKALLIDRWLRQLLDPAAVFEFAPAVDPVLHRLEVPVPVPQFAEEIRDEVLDQLTRMQFEETDPAGLQAARASALEFLGDRSVLEWFASQDLWNALEVGWSVVRDLTGEGLRSAIRDFEAQGRVVAYWSSAFDQPAVTVESLGEPVGIVAEVPRPLGRAPGRVVLPPLDAVGFGEPLPIRVDQLDSGLAVVEDSGHGIFVAGRFESALPGGMASAGVAGTFWSFADPPAEDVFERLRSVRPDRILFLAPAAALPALRNRLANWTIADLDSTSTLFRGPVAAGDLPSLLVLKTWLDARVIEAGWWGRVDLRIEAISGSQLIIDAGATEAAEIHSWIREVATAGLDEQEFLRVRSAALGYYERIRRDLAILLWRRDPRGILPLPTAVSPARLRDVARIYF